MGIHSTAAVVAVAAAVAGVAGSAAKASPSKAADSIADNPVRRRRSRADTKVGHTLAAAVSRKAAVATIRVVDLADTRAAASAAVSVQASHVVRARAAVAGPDRGGGRGAGRGAGLAGGFRARADPGGPGRRGVARLPGEGAGAP